MSSLILRTAMRLLLPLILLFGVYMILKGHNEPGGGFIGGLVIAVGLALYRLVFGDAALRRMMPVHPRIVVFIGLLLATATAVVPLLIGQPLLTSWHGVIPVFFHETYHFATVLIFDLGVVFVVVGASVGMTSRLAEEVEDDDARWHAEHGTDEAFDPGRSARPEPLMQDGGGI